MDKPDFVTEWLCAHIARRCRVVESAGKTQARVVKGDDAENTLLHYGTLTHLGPVVVKSVCGGYLGCGLSAGLWRVVSNPPSPLRHLSC